MKVEAITLREIQMPLVHFFETSFGRTYDRRLLLVTLHSNGLEGWAECVAGDFPLAPVLPLEIREQNIRLLRSRHSGEGADK